MKVNRRTQEERSAATRAALVAAARPLFAEHGFAAVGTEAIAASAGVTRGALYHQFADKTELFAAVFEAVEADLLARIASLVADATGPFEALLRGADAWLDASADPEVERIALLDGPAVLGWERWRAIGQRYGAGLVESALEEAMTAGELVRQPTAPLAHVLFGALDEAALYVARAADPGSARAEMRGVLRALLGGLGASPRR